MLKELVKANRSYRTFKENYEISREVLLELIDTARLTPSAVNAQVLKYVPLERDMANKILPYTYWAKALTNIKLPPENHGPSAFILVCVDKSKCQNISTALKDVGIVSQTILLEAVEMGLGGCMIGSFDAGEIERMLGLGEDIRINLCIALGKPDETIVLEEAEGENVKYYRTEDNIHHVPKRKLEDVVIKLH